VVRLGLGGADVLCSTAAVTVTGAARKSQWRYVGSFRPFGPLRPPRVPPSGPPGASWIPLVPSGPLGVSLDPPAFPPVPLVSHGPYSSAVIG
jgi:hypothetical protein